MVNWLQGRRGMMEGSAGEKMLETWPGNQEGREKPGRKMYLPGHTPSNSLTLIHLHLLIAHSTINTSVD